MSEETDDTDTMFNDEDSQAFSSKGRGGKKSKYEAAGAKIAELAEPIKTKLEKDGICVLTPKHLGLEGTVKTVMSHKMTIGEDGSVTGTKSGQVRVSWYRVCEFLAANGIVNVTVQAKNVGLEGAEEARFGIRKLA